MVGCCVRTSVPSAHAWDSLYTREFDQKFSFDSCSSLQRVTGRLAATEARSPFARGDCPVVLNGTTRVCEQAP